MKIKVKLFASLRQERFDENEFEIDAGSDVDFLLNKFSLKHEDVNIVFINGIHADYNTILNDGDDVAFFPLLGGG
jgi:molybdopterin converting factor small subunit